MFKKYTARFQTLWSDVKTYMSNLYEAHGQNFSVASPFAQILQVILNLGKMIFFYIEDAITELNIKTAQRPSSVKGLMTLTGHDPFRGCASRGVVRLSIKNNASEHYGKTITFPNMLKLYNSTNGQLYIGILPAESAKMKLSAESFIDMVIIQGSIDFQQATGTGLVMQSFNFRTKGDVPTDHYMTKVYVDGKLWKNVSSILDMDKDEEAVIIRSGHSGGIDIFFGNSDNGKVPNLGSTIQIEYLVTNGHIGNMYLKDASRSETWTIHGNGKTSNGDDLSLQNILSVQGITDVIMGADSEPMTLTRHIAPLSSRSMVLANKANYEYFLKKLNMFSVVDVIRGDNTFEDVQLKSQFNSIENSIKTKKSEYYTAVAKWGEDHNIPKGIEKELKELGIKLKYVSERLQNASQDDNTVYLFLIPDLKQRIGNKNYFTIEEEKFTLSKDEMLSIIDLIESSGQRIITVDNKILNPKTPRFAINVSVRRWSNADESQIRNNIISALSDYLIGLQRRDRVPQSDIVRVCENVNGVDSVRVEFVADRNNEKIFGIGEYGIDESGDVTLTRHIQDYQGGFKELRDVLPLFRGGFTAPNNVYYGDSITDKSLGAVNVSFYGVTDIDKGNYYRGSTIS